MPPQVRGVRCRKCKVFEPYSPWALAHVGTLVTFRCPVCKSEQDHTIK